MWNRLCTSVCVLLPDNPRQSSHVPAYIRLLDINDNAPTFATLYETFVCEKTKAGQVLQLYVLTVIKARVFYCTALIDRQEDHEGFIVFSEVTMHWDTV